MLSSEFLLTSLIVVLIPGTGVIYTVSIGVFQGWRLSIVAAFGCTAGIIPHLLASLFGLSFILHMSAAVFQGIKWLGVLYLLYLAWMMWREKGGFSFDSISHQNNLGQIAGKAVLINLLNPKLTLFFFTFLPLFVSSNTSVALTEMLKLSATFMLITLVVFVLYGVLASSVRQHLANSPKTIRWLRRSFALMFAGLGIRLLTSNP